MQINNLQLILALILSMFVGGVAGYLGTLMLTKRMSLVGGPLGHLTLPGIALALVYGFDVSLGALAFLLVGIALIWLFEKKTRLPLEALTAVVFSSSLAVAFLFLPEDETVEALIGNISQITPAVVIITVLVSLIIFLVTRLIYRKMIFVSVSEDLAKSRGINVQRYNLIYLFCIAAVVALSVRIVGGLLTAALVAIPASTSKNLSGNLTQYSHLGLVLGGLAGAFGVLAFRFTNIPAGPAIIIISTIFFLLSILVKKRN